MEINEELVISGIEIGLQNFLGILEDKIEKILNECPELEKSDLRVCIGEADGEYGKHLSMFLHYDR